MGFQTDVLLSAVYDHLLFLYKKNYKQALVMNMGQAGRLSIVQSL